MNKKEQLPDFVLADLYSKSLVFISDEQGAETESPGIKKTYEKYIGDYKSKIVVLVNDIDAPYLNEYDFSFLSGVLNACKLNIAHIALINFDKHIFSFGQLKKDMMPEYLLCFGVNALQIELPFTMPDYQVQLYDKCQIITAPPLAVLNQSKTEKAKLWKSLQKMFNLEK